MNIFKVFLSFLKVGTIGFGGGSALIPVVEKELVQDQKAMSDADYLKHTVVANITPGALPVKLGATCGYQLKGTAGSLVGAFSVTFPGLLFTVAFMALFSVLGEGIINYFNYAAVGITAFIVFLLLSYVVKTVGIGNKRINLALCLTAFVLTGGKEIREIISQLFSIDMKVLGTPLFDISTIDLILMSFFVILLLEKLKSKTELYIVLGVSLLYAFTAGKTGKLLGLASYKSILLIIMILSVILLFVLRKNETRNKSRITISRSTLATIAIFLIIPIILGLLVNYLFFMSAEKNLFEFLVNVASSTITSFGGGEAYVSVADGIFVQGGFIEPDKFYTRLVPVANSLPGPILVKIAAGMGYLFGEQTAGAIAGWAVAAVAGVMAIGVCCAIAILVISLYDSVKQWEFISNLKKYILPVICGMLLSTSGAMLFESMKITGGEGIPGFVSLPAIFALIYGIYFLHKKFHLHDVLLLLISAAVSLGILIL
jgi:chromate transporter